MSDWKVLYRDQLDQNRTSQNVQAKKPRLSGRVTCITGNVLNYPRIEGPSGLALSKQEIMRWVSANK